MYPSMYNTDAAGILENDGKGGALSPTVNLFHGFPLMTLSSSSSQVDPLLWRRPPGVWGPDRPGRRRPLRLRGRPHRRGCLRSGMRRRNIQVTLIIANKKIPEVRIVAAFCVSEFKHVLTTFLAIRTRHQKLCCRQHPKRKFF